MKSLWNEEAAQACAGDLMQLRVYTSRLLGANPDLVLHGGGNTSVKLTANNFFGEPEELLFVKGSGWDLATIEAPGFAPVKLDVLKRLADLETLSDTEMVRQQRAAMTDPGAPNPSVEAILHAIIPFRFVDHTHADAVLGVTNHPNGDECIREIYGNRVLVVPYVMPGFVLARKVRELTQGIDWSEYEGMILMQHGIFTFDDDARESYEKMIRLVTEAEAYAERQGAKAPRSDSVQEDLPQLAEIRRQVSLAKGQAMLAQLDQSGAAGGFANRPDAAQIGTRGPLTPDHVLRTKLKPVVLDGNAEQEVQAFREDYQDYFEHNTDGALTCLDPAPRWGIWPKHGTLAFGRSVKETGIISDLIEHTRRTIQQVEDWSAWQALPEKDIFEVEYWELEQAKLGKAGTPKPFQGRVALVSGAASGIGRACAETLHSQGAAVVGLDLNPEIESLLRGSGLCGIRCDVTDDAALRDAVEFTVRKFGGLDVLVSNAGNFPAGKAIGEMDPETWDRSMQLNLSSHQRLLTAATPFLEKSWEGSVIFIASRNVPAPGPGASAYSVAKAGLTQLARIASLELGAHGVRVNVLHPDCVYDTGIWSDGVLEQRAQRYGITVAEYKARNVLKQEVTSQEVAELVATVAGPAFAKTTGAQIPIDGGNDRVI